MSQSLLAPRANSTHDIAHPTALPNVARQRRPTALRRLAMAYPVQTGLAGLATLIIMVFFRIFYTAQATTAFLDGTARLNLARRVFDNVDGRISLPQIGGIWLPLMPLLELPTVWNDYLYRTGISGSLISMVSFVALIVIVFETATCLTHRRVGGLAAAAVLALNLNVLVFGTNTMAEMLLMASLAWCGLCLIKLEQTTSEGSVDLRWLAMSSIAFALACLVRYEAYYLTVAAVPLTALILWRRQLRGTQLLATMGTMFSVPLLSIAGWLVYELLIFGDPLYFARSSYSARAIDVVNRLDGPVGHPIRAFRDYAGAVRWNYPDLVITLALIGSAVYLARLLSRADAPLAVVYFAFVPAFYLTSLVTGQIGLDAGSSYPYNIRYGLPVGITLAVAAGYLVGMVATVAWRRCGPVVAMVALVSLVTVALPLWQQPVANARILQDNGAKLPPGSTEMAAWLRERYDGGLILIEAFGWDKAYIQVASDIPLHAYLTEASPARWHAALRDPAAYVDWVFVGSSQDDAVRQAVATSPTFQTAFVPVFTTATGVLYEKRSRLEAS